jgi:hypothetical protein
MHSIFTKIPPFDSTLNYVVIFRQLDRVAIVDGGIVRHVVLWWGCGLGMGKAFDFVCRNISEVRIILALEIVCRQAGQMLYPYGGCLCHSQI